MEHEYLATVPFDLYQLHLFHLVVKHRSFTRAAGLAGLTQSAITRQMQGMENSLGSIS
jgi:DNA-binding transcriptional LysR family regulator